MLARIEVAGDRDTEYSLSRIMPSRKKVKGKARKAAKEAKVKAEEEENQAMLMDLAISRWENYFNGMSSDVPRHKHASMEYLHYHLAI